MSTRATAEPAHLGMVGRGTVARIVHWVPSFGLTFVVEDGTVPGVDVHSDVVVIGAGPAGLAAALRALRSGASVTVVEGASEVGGLCRTIEVDGCRIDIGGHIPFFRADARVAWAEEILNRPLRWINQPVARVEDGQVRPGRYIDQRPVDPPDRIPRDGTAAGELGATMGVACRDRIARPYMEKIDGWPLETISADRAQRLRDEQRAPEGFWFPAGGIGTLMDSMAGAIRRSGGAVLLDTPVTALRHDDGRALGVQVAGADPGTIHAHTVICAVAPEAIVRVATPPAPDGLRADITMRAVALVYLVADRERITGSAWVQVADPAVPFARIAEFAHWDPGMVPAGRTVLCAEVYMRGGDDDPLWAQDDVALSRACAQAVANPLGWVDDAAVLRPLHVIRLPRAYPLVEAWRLTEASRAQTWLAGLDGLEIARGGTVVTAIEAGEAAADRAGHSTPPATR